MITVVCSLNDREKYEKYLEPSLKRAESYNTEQGIEGLQVLLMDEGYETIGQAYNHAMELAKYPIKLFVHEDLDLGDPSWQLKLMAAFTLYPEVGLVGIAGGEKLAKGAVNWWENGTGDDEQYIWGRQEVNDYAWYWKNVKFFKNHLEVIDGCFMATDKNVYFDEATADGYFLANYDKDVSLSIRELGYTIGVIDHLTHHHPVKRGRIDQNLMDKLYRVYFNKWNDSVAGGV